MENTTTSATKTDIPADWTADAVAILGRLESRLAGGLHIERVALGIESSTEWIHSLLDSGNRARLGRENSAQLAYDSAKTRELLFKINAFLDKFDADRRQRALTYTEIDTGHQIAALAIDSLQKKRLFHLIGALGISKSLTLRRFAEKHPMTHETPGATYLELAHEDRTVSQLYQRIYDAMRLHERFGSRGRAIGQYVRNSLRSGDLLIIDEANYAFEHGIWQTLRDIFDKSPASLLMVSNPTANGFTKKNADELGAFLSRARTRRIDGNIPADGEKYAQALGYTCGKIISEAGQIVVRTGYNGGMRALAKAFEDAEQKASAMHVPVNVGLLREAAKINSVFFR